MLRQDFMISFKLWLALVFRKIEVTHHHKKLQVVAGSQLILMEEISGTAVLACGITPLQNSLFK